VSRTVELTAAAISGAIIALVGVIHNVGRYTAGRRECGRAGNRVLV